MDPKTFYTKKLQLLSTALGTVATLRGQWTQLADHEDTAPGGDIGELHSLLVAIDSVERELKDLTEAVEVLGLDK